MLARICTTAIFMTYPACLSVLLTEWQMSATRAGIVQGAFTAAFAVLGAVCSVSIGWLTNISAPLLLAITAVYGFATIGDSSVLSSAMTDAVPVQHLGRVLGLRSVLGVGAGALSPALFGLTLDLAPAALAWGYAFSTLALGALVAILCAVLLRRDGG